MKRGKAGKGETKRGSETHNPQPSSTSSTAQPVPSSAWLLHTLPQLHQDCRNDPARLSGPPDRKRHPAPGPAVQPAQPPSPARRAALTATTARVPRCRSTVELRRPPLDRHLQPPLPKTQSHPNGLSGRASSIHPQPKTKC